MGDMGEVCFYPLGHRPPGAWGLSLESISCACPSTATSRRFRVRADRKQSIIATTRACVRGGTVARLRRRSRRRWLLLLLRLLRLDGRSRRTCCRSGSSRASARARCVMVVAGGTVRVQMTVPMRLVPMEVMVMLGM